jgi:hypothetical protein
MAVDVGYRTLATAEKVDLDDVCVGLQQFPFFP